MWACSQLDLLSSTRTGDKVQGYPLGVSRLESGYPPVLPGRSRRSGQRGLSPGTEELCHGLQRCRAGGEGTGEGVRTQVPSADCHFGTAGDVSTSYPAEPRIAVILLEATVAPPRVARSVPESREQSRSLGAARPRTPRAGKQRARVVELVAQRAAHLPSNGELPAQAPHAAVPGHAPATSRSVSMFDPDVDGSRGQVLMPQHPADLRQVGPAAQHLPCQGVTHPVRRRPVSAAPGSFRAPHRPWPRNPR